MQEENENNGEPKYLYVSSPPIFPPRSKSQAKRTIVQNDNNRLILAESYPNNIDDS
jgi:hypothetical protein